MPGAMPPWGVHDQSARAMPPALAPAISAPRPRAECEPPYAAPAARLLAPAVPHHAQKRLEADLARLKELVEAHS